MAGFRYLMNKVSNNWERGQGKAKGKMFQGKDETWSWSPAQGGGGPFAKMGGDLVGSSPVNGGSLETWLTLIVNLVWPRVMCEKPPLRYYLDHVGLWA